MPNDTGQITLSLPELRELAGYAAGCAQGVLGIFERARPDDPRPREALDAAWAFARGGNRGKALRVTALAAMRAGRDADEAAGGTADQAAGGAVGEAARAAMCAASAAYLHPLAKADQVKHILGATAYAARAAELAAGDDREVGADHVARALREAPPTVVDVLGRYPAAPPGGGRVGELLRELDGALRRRS